MHREPHPFVASALALAVVGSSVGCTSVDENLVKGASGDPATSALDVRVFDREKDKRAGHLSEGRVALELATPSGEVLHRGEAPAWSVANLEPGKYQLTISQWKLETPPNDKPDAKRSITVKLRPGDRQVVDMVASKPEKGVAIGVGTAAIIAVSVAAFAALLNTLKWSSSERFTAEPLPTGVASSRVPAGAPPPPEELEKIMRAAGELVVE
jgi:hypothetical protein